MKRIIVYLLLVALLLLSWVIYDLDKDINTLENKLDKAKLQLEFIQGNSNLKIIHPYETSTTFKFELPKKEHKNKK